MRILAIYFLFYIKSSGTNLCQTIRLINKLVLEQICKLGELLPSSIFSQNGVYYDSNINFGFYRFGKLTSKGI